MNEEYYKGLALKECLLLLVNETIKYITNIIENNSDLTKSDKISIAQSFMLFYNLKKIELNPLVYTHTLQDKGVFIKFF